MWDYAAFTDGEENPHLMPNEIAYKLSELIGYDHYLIHRALVSLNPKLIDIDGDFHLELDFLPVVAAKIGEMLLAEVILNP